MIINLLGGSSPVLPAALPVLDPSYPQDATIYIPFGGTASVTFSAVILEDGIPASYSYKWYFNDLLVLGLYGPVLTRDNLKEGIYTVRCEVTNQAGSVTTRLATINILVEE